MSDLIYRVFAIAVAVTMTCCGGGSTTATPTPGATVAPTRTPLPAFDPVSGLPLARVVVERNGGRREEVVVEIASTPQQRQLGLMHRESMAEDRGMLFLFPGDDSGGFWMKDTLIPLDIAYIGANGRINEIRMGVPKDTTILRPTQPYRFVLEMNRGWFERHELGTGDEIRLPAGLPKPQ